MTKPSPDKALLALKILEEYFEGMTFHEDLLREMERRLKDDKIVKNNTQYH